jgi:hypothetical protein
MLTPATWWGRFLTGAIPVCYGLAALPYSLLPEARNRSVPRHRGLQTARSSGILGFCAQEVRLLDGVLVPSHRSGMLQLMTVVKAMRLYRLV